MSHSSQNKSRSPIYTWLRLFLCGLCIGATDIIPGISGGTMAFIMGFYEELLSSIKSINGQALSDLLHLRFRSFQQRVNWQFLLPMGSGIILAFALLARSIQYLLADPTYHTILCAGFLGLILASAVCCARQINRWKLSHYIAFLLGACAAYLLTNLPTLAQVTTLSAHPEHWFNGWFICCGAIAITAMLLPGISGSYLLTILGVYATAIGAVADLSHGLQNGELNTDAFLLLSNFAIGIIAGALLFSRLILFLFRQYQQATIALLTGFMIGALRSVWPFWTYTYPSPALSEGKILPLHLQEPIMPDFSSSLFFMATTAMVVGFLLVTLIDRRQRSLRARETHKPTQTYG